MSEIQVDVVAEKPSVDLKQVGQQLRPGHQLAKLGLAVIEGLIQEPTDCFFRQQLVNGLGAVL